MWFFLPKKGTSLIKKFIENAKICKDNSKDDLTRFTSEKEIEILSEYLPKQLTEDEIRNIIVTFIDAGSRNLGDIMKHFKNNFSGQYDGGLVSSIAKQVM